MEDLIEVADAKITIRYSLGSDVKKKLEEHGNEKCNTLFRATVFDTIIFMGREARYYIPNNVLELVDDLPSWNAYPWGEYFWRIFYLWTLKVVPQKNERDFKKDKEKVLEPSKKKKKPAKGSKKKNKADEQSSKKMTTYNLYGLVWSLKESNIHSHDPVEQQNSPNMSKEHVLAEFDAIKETVDITDKIKGEVSTSCLEKELDIVKDRIAVLEKCFKLSYQDTSEDSEYRVLRGFVLHRSLINNSASLSNKFGESYFIFKFGISGLLHHVVTTITDRIRDQPLNDNVPKGLVKLVDMMASEDNMSDYKVDETVSGGVIVDHRVQSLKNPSLINIVEDSRPFARIQKRNQTGYVKEPNTIVDYPDLTKIVVDPWVETTYIFRWNKTGHIVDRDFWLTLLGCSNRGWLSDKLDDDWAIVGPYFCAFVVRGNVPFWLANRVKYLISWIEVDRVFIPINEPKKDY
nr:hypothetical protein [Tanacetum cinerariifolium]